MKSEWKIKVLDPFFLMKVMDRDTMYLERNVLKSVSVIALLTMVFSYEKIFCSGKLMQVLKHKTNAYAGSSKRAYSSQLLQPY